MHVMLFMGRHKTCPPDLKGVLALYNPFSNVEHLLENPDFEMYVIFSPKGPLDCDLYHGDDLGMELARQGVGRRPGSDQGPHLLGGGIGHGHCNHGGAHHVEPTSRGQCCAEHQPYGSIWLSTCEVY